MVGSADVSTLDLRSLPPLNQNGIAHDLRLRAAFTERPAVSMLPFSYHWVPPNVRWFLARNIGSRLRSKQHAWARYPDWPLDLSADFVSDWSAMDEEVPIPRPAPVLLTHDIDSPEGLRNLVELFLPIEEAAGARSTNYVVPCGWQLDHGLLREIIQRGHEIGVHGYDHSNRTPFLGSHERRRRLGDGRSVLEAYSPSGYRAPSLVRTSALVEDLADYFLYDSSIPTSGGPFPVFNNGCATARLFRIGRTLEIPITLRRDGSMQFLGYSPAEIGAVWRENAEQIAASRGIVSLLTHCERRFSGNRPMLDAYRQFLEFLRPSPRFEWSRADRVAANIVLP